MPDPVTSPPPAPAPAPDPAPSDTAPAPQPGATVRPATGPSTGGTWVSIDGSFDVGPYYYVHIGSQVLVPRVVMSHTLQVLTAPSAATGPQDVVVHRLGAGEVARHPGAFTFLQDGGGTTPSPDEQPAPAPSPPAPAPSAPTPDDGSAPAPSPTPDPDGGGTPTPDPAPAPGHGGTAPDPIPTDGSDPAPDDDAPPAVPGWPSLTLGAPLDAGDGLVLDRIVDGPLASLTVDAWTTVPCAVDPCAGIRMR